MDTKLFSNSEERIVKTLLKAALVYAPNIELNKTIISVDELTFKWDTLPPGQYVSPVYWWTTIVSVAYPPEGMDPKVHILRVLPRLLAQLYNQLDYKQHRLAHFLNAIIHKDGYGSYRRNFLHAVALYKSVRLAYEAIAAFVNRGIHDPDAQYELKKTLTNKYGSAVEIALTLYRMPLCDL